MLQKIADHYKIQFTPAEIQSFSLLSTFGVPIKQLKQFLDMNPDARKSVKQAGIPCDSLNNELADWILFGRQSNPKFRIAVKGDQDAKYPVVHKVIKTLQDRKVDKFNFITSLEKAPE